jgi:hypothetical protein
MTTETPETPETADPTPEEGEESQELTNEDRYQLVSKIIGREIFIDPLDAEQITKAYSIYERNPQKIIEVLIESFRQYCRKCIRESAIIDVKDEVSQLPQTEADKLKAKVTQDQFTKIENDKAIEQLLIMMIFKNQYWEWVRFGLKDIFSSQRMQPGHEINSYLNARFHKLKNEKKYKVVRDLVLADVTDIVNRFKGELMEKKIKLFD